ncbi:MAG: hypothetical protein KF832_02640 [Caldilineaceae bacterium]|nr:hypothetical protein [Caldilineaceae bacterium]
MDEVAGVYKFASVGELAETVTQLLALGLQYGTDLGRPSSHRSKSGIEKIEQLILQQARDYVAEVREGFVLSTRTAQRAEQAELRFLVDQVLIDWNAFSREMGLVTTDEAGNAPTHDETIQPEQVRQQLLAFGMAITALGQLPKLPAEKITFPYSYNDPPTYADIPAPETPGAILSRIEELEQMIWQLMGGNLQGLLHHRYGALRRTYGFFEVSAHLARRETERFGLKRRSSSLTLL